MEAQGSSEGRFHQADSARRDNISKNEYGMHKRVSGNMAVESRAQLWMKTFTVLCARTVRHILKVLLQQYDIRGDTVLQCMTEGILRD